MTLGDDSARKDNFQRKGQPQALRTMIEGSANTYASMLNATLFPFLLYQQSLAMATRAALSSLQSATGVARQGIEAGDETHRQDVELISQAATGNNVQTTGRVALQQDVEATGETGQESGVEATEQTPPEVDEVASGLSEPVSPPLETPNTVDELPPSSPALEVPDEPAAETDQGSRETSSRVDGEGDEAYPGPPAPVPSSPAQEGSVTAEDPSPVPVQQEESPTNETITEELLPPPPEVPDVELPPPPPVPSVTDELSPAPTPEAPEDEPTTPPTRGEKPRVRVRRTTAAARRRAEELGVDLAEVEGTGQGGRIVADDVRRKARNG